MSSDKLRKEKDCLNCGHRVEEIFCPHCGQKNIEVKEPAIKMIIHAIADYFHFEHTFFRTLKPLLFKPGFLTNEYIAGKRESYLNPIRLYIFISILFFLVILAGKNHTPEKEAVTGDDAIENEVENGKTIPGNFTDLNRIVADTTNNPVKLQIDTEKNDIGSIFSIVIETLFSNWKTADPSIQYYKQRQAALPPAERDNFFKTAYIKKHLALKNSPYQREKFREDLIHNIPKMMFLLLPVFALILKLVYIRKKKVLL